MIEGIRVNQTLLRQYTILVDFLSQVIGPDYEIALHDLSEKDNSIVAIANGQISGRTLGAPLPAPVFMSAVENNSRGSNYRINYSGLTVGNKVLRSSSLYIKDASGKLVGLLCVNFDDARYQELSTRLLQLCHPDEFVERNIVIRSDILGAEPVSGEDADSLISIANSVIAEVVSEDGVPVERLTQEEKVRIVRMLHQRGVFYLKGAVREVSKVLRCSPASIYRYLGKLGGRGDGEAGPEPA